MSLDHKEKMSEPHLSAGTTGCFKQPTRSDRGLDVYWTNTLNPEWYTKKEQKRTKKRNPKAHGNKKKINKDESLSCPHKVQPRSPVPNQTINTSPRNKLTSLSTQKYPANLQPPPLASAPPQLPNMNAQTTGIQPHSQKLLNSAQDSGSRSTNDTHCHGWSIRRLLSRRGSRRYSVLEREPNRLRKRMSNWVWDCTKSHTYTGSRTGVSEN